MSEEMLAQLEEMIEEWLALEIKAASVKRETTVELEPLIAKRDTATLAEDRAHTVVQVLKSVRTKWLENDGS